MESNQLSSAYKAAASPAMLKGQKPENKLGSVCLVPCVGFDTYKPRTLKVRIHFVLSTALCIIFTPFLTESQEVCEITRY